MLRPRFLMFQSKVLLSKVRQVGILGQGGILFYPTVLSAYPVIFWYAMNADEADLYQVLVSLGVMVALTVLATIFLKLFINDNAKVATVITFCLGFFFIYGPAELLLSRKFQASVGGISIGEEPYLPIIVLALAVICVSVVIKTRKNLAPFVRVTASIVLLLLLYNIGRIVIEKSVTENAVIDGQTVSRGSFALPDFDQLPDIYYIVLDTYGRDDVLMDYYGFDNSAFIEFLTDRGFYIASESMSNYPQATEFSIASSLGMRYLINNDQPGRLIEGNQIVTLLNSIGYKFVHLSSGWYLTYADHRAEVEYSHDDPLKLLVNDFSMAFLGRTLARPLADAVGVNLVARQYTEDYARNFTNIIDWLPRVSEDKDPTFTFVHSRPPHPPFVFDRLGNVFAENRSFNVHEEANQAYIDQLFYVSRSVESAIDKILTQSAPNVPIIIIQGDHGPPGAEDPITITTEAAEARYKLERSPILNAYLLPPTCKSGLYPTISPVNSFRVVLNSCFGANLDLLEDLVYWYNDLRDTSIPPVDFSKLAK